MRFSGDIEEVRVELEIAEIRGVSPFSEQVSRTVRQKSRQESARVLLEREEVTSGECRVQ